MDIKNYTAKVSLKNKQYLKELTELCNEYPIIGIIDVLGLPAKQFQRMRASLKKTAKVLIVKKNLIEIVFNKLDKTKLKGIAPLLEKSSGIVGVILTKNNPFTLFKTIKKNKSSAPAKGGQIAPNDIVVPAGPTNFAPGPIIGELGGVKIKAGIANGKVEIKEDSLVAKEGEVISEKLAGVLARLNIEPMEVGLNIKGIYENGTIFDKAVLDVDEDKILSDLKNGATSAFNLSLGLGYITKSNIQMLLSKASKNSLSLGLGVNYPATDTIKQLIKKSQSQMVGLSLSLPEDVRPSGIEVSQNTGTAPATTQVEEKVEKKKEEPVDASAGLGNLF